MLGVIELKETANPELAVALTVVVPFTATVAGANVATPMVWSALFTVRLTDAVALL